MNENDRESMKFAEKRSGLMREGSGRQRNAERSENAFSENQESRKYRNKQTTNFLYMIQFSGLAAPAPIRGRNRAMRAHVLFSLKIYKTRPAQ